MSRFLWFTVYIEKFCFNIFMLLLDT